jgi:hypothetical protein
MDANAGVDGKNRCGAQLKNGERRPAFSEQLCSATQTRSHSPFHTKSLNFLNVSRRERSITALPSPTNEKFLINDEFDSPIRRHTGGPMKT